MGLFSLVQALCYAELASVIPKTGGDYTYIYLILGELPAFVTAWGQIFMVMTTSNAAIALTASVYLWQPFGLDCQNSIVTCTAIVIICEFHKCFSFVNLTISTIKCKSKSQISQIPVWEMFPAPLKNRSLRIRELQKHKAWHQDWRHLFHLQADSVGLHHHHGRWTHDCWSHWKLQRPVEGLQHSPRSSRSGRSQRLLRV